MRSYHPFHGTRLREWRSSLVKLSETTYGPAQRTAQHAHEETTLAFVVSGGFHERQANKRIECGRAALLLRPAGVEHEDVFAGECSTCFNVEIAKGALGEDDVTGACVRGGRAEWLAVRLLIALRERMSDETLSIESDVADLVDALAPIAVRRIPDRVRRVVARLEEGVAERWSLRELAREAGVHPMHLTRAFRRERGESVGQALRRLRVERAARLIVDTPRSLAAIAAETGFADQAHLTRVFRRHTGMTPARYRAALR
jgi:AraC family transcriptional regulator